MNKNKLLAVIVIILIFLFSSTTVTSLTVDKKIDFVKQNYSQDDDVLLLWKVFTDTGYDIGSALINDDNFPDILACNYALDGTNGDIIYNFESSFIGSGDINNDGKDEIFTRYETEDSEILRCIDPFDGNIKWERDLESITFKCISIGDVIGDEYNEVVVGLRDDVVCCMNGLTGNIIWRKQLSNEGSTWILCSEIADVNNDGLNEVIVSTNQNDAHVFCLEGVDGDVIWKFTPFWNPYPSFRTLCIDDLNDDPFLEIVVELDDFHPIDAYGVQCLSGDNKNSLWVWGEDPNVGSFQAIIAADLIPGVPGKEIIAGGCGGLYCLYGGDNPPSGGRVIWHAGGIDDNDIVPCIVISAAVGDLDGDGLLDVVGGTSKFIGSGGAGIYAVNGQYGSLLWKMKGVGTDSQNSILCVDLDNDGSDEVVSINSHYDEVRLFNVTALKSDFPSDNHAPNKPSLNGPTEGQKGRTYDYYASCSDPEDDGIYYYFEWDDGTGDVSLVKASGLSVAQSKSWKKAGTYTVKVKAIDEHGAESDWSDPLSVSVPKAKQKTFNPIFSELIKNLFYYFSFLKTFIHNLIN